jgi:hypothetical protein
MRPAKMIAARAICDEHSLAFSDGTFGSSCWGHLGLPCVRTRPSGSVATSSEQDMRFVAPSSGLADAGLDPCA